jgi:hypothetical protein
MAICWNYSKGSDGQDYHRRCTSRFLNRATVGTFKAHTHGKSVGDAHIDFFWPLILLCSDKNLTLQIGLASLLTPYGSNYDLLLTGSVLATIPIIILFVLFQRYFISGILAGGLKG